MTTSTTYPPAEEIPASAMALTTMAVVGAGTMGSGIAQTLALTAFQRVLLYDPYDASLQKAEKTIQASLQKLVDKGKLPDAQRQEALERLQLTTEMTLLKDAQCVIEAAPEDLSLKGKIFAQLADILSPEAILASNTSALSITQLAQHTARPGRLLGVHFFNPVPVLPLVEVIEGQHTQPDVTATALGLVRRIGKTPVLVKESPGFVVNRILIPMINEAATLLGENVATPQDIDTAMRLGANHPIGPLALADLVGLDVCLAIMDTLKAGLAPNSPKYEAAPLLRQKVAEGKLGRKTGEGFYTYDAR